MMSPEEKRKSRRFAEGLDRFIADEDHDLLPDWNLTEQHPMDIGWYAVHSTDEPDFNSHGKQARYWDGDCWMMPSRNDGFHPNDSFTHWTELPDFYT